MHIHKYIYARLKECSLKQNANFCLGSLLLHFHFRMMSCTSEYHINTYWKTLKHCTIRQL